MPYLALPVITAFSLFAMMPSHCFLQMVHSNFVISLLLLKKHCHKYNKYLIAMWLFQTVKHAF